jgi:hypothetical protein
MPTVVTANDLRSGSVVYLHHSEGWVSQLERAAIADDPEAMEQMKRLALSDMQGCKVTAVYAFDVHVIDGHPYPISVRERLRAAHAATS